MTQALVIRDTCSQLRNSLQVTWSYLLQSITGMVAT